MTVTIATPERHVLGPIEVVSVTLPGDKGEMTLLPGHARLVSTLAVGGLSLEYADGTKKVAALSGGFVEIHSDQVVVLADTLELADQIDLERAKIAEQRALNLLSSKDDGSTDKSSIQADLTRALNRQEMAQRIQRQ